MLTLSRDLSSPIENNVGVARPSSSVEILEFKAYLKQKIENDVRRAREARMTMDRRAVTRKRNYDKRRREVDMEVDDQVLVKTNPVAVAGKNFTAKLAPRWEGPYMSY